MSEPNIGGGCHECGGQYEHKEFCSKTAPPPVVYDLAEFERQLEKRVKWAESMDSKQAQLTAEIFKCILVDLRSSKRP